MTLITGMMRDKQVEACASILAPLFPRVVATRVSEPRAAEPERVAAAYAAWAAMCARRSRWKRRSPPFPARAWWPVPSISWARRGRC